MFPENTANTKAYRDFPNHRSKATAENPKHPAPINEKGSTNFHQTEDKNKKERFLQSGNFQRKPQLPIAIEIWHLRPGTNFQALLERKGQMGSH